MRKCRNCGQSLTNAERYPTGIRGIVRDSIGRPVPIEVYAWVAKRNTCGDVYHELEGIDVCHKEIVGVDFVSAGGLSKDELARAYALMYIQAGEKFAAQGDKETAREEFECAFLTVCQLESSSDDDLIDKIREIAIKYDIE